MRFVIGRSGAITDAPLRRSMQRDIALQVMVTVAVAAAVSLLLSRVPIVELNDALLPQLVWQTNRVTIVLFVAFVVEWCVAALWPAREEQDAQRLAPSLGRHF